MLKRLFTGLLPLSAAPFLLFAQAPVADLGSGSLADRIAMLERMLTARNRAQIEMQQQLDALQDEVNELRGVTETHSYKLEQMIQRQRELYQEIDRRMNELAQTPVPALPAQNPADSAEYSGTLSENDAYDRAVNLILRDKRYDQAIVEFQAFLKNFPESAYVANAHYWLGQLLFNKGEWKQAEAHFGKVVRQFPDSNKRPDAMLKLGILAQKQQQPDEARRLYQQLMDQYPDSSAAAIAASRLAGLDKGQAKTGG